MNDFLLANYIAKSLKKCKNEKTAPMEYAEIIKKDILGQASRPTVPNAVELNNRIKQICNGSNQQYDKIPYPPHFLHRISTDQMGKRASYQTRSAVFTANTVAKLFVLCANAEERLGITDFFEQDETEQIYILWTALFADGKTPDAFRTLPNDEKNACFLDWLQLQERMLGTLYETFSDEQLLDFAEEYGVSLQIGKQMSAEKTAQLVEFLGITPNDNILENYEENYEPFLPILHSLLIKINDMANPYYREYEMADIKEAAKLFDSPLTNHLGDISKASETTDDIPITGFQAILYEIQAEDTSSIPISGTVSACFDSWMHWYCGNKNISIYNSSQPQSPIADLDICTALLLQGTYLIVIDSDNVPHVICAEKTTGQIREVQRNCLFDYTDEWQVKMFASDTEIELALCDRFSDGESYKLLKFALKELCKANPTETESYILLMQKTVDATQSYLEEKRLTEHQYGEKIQSHLTLAVKVEQRLNASICLGTFRQAHPEIIYSDDKTTYELIQAEHNSRPIPSLHLGPYANAYRKEQKLLDALCEKIQESQISYDEAKTVVSSSTNETSENRLLENMELEEQLYSYLQTEKDDSKSIEETPINGHPEKISDNQSRSTTD